MTKKKEKYSFNNLFAINKLTPRAKVIIKLVFVIPFSIVGIFWLDKSLNLGLSNMVVILIIVYIYVLSTWVRRLILEPFLVAVKNGFGILNFKINYKKGKLQILVFHKNKVEEDT